MRNLSRNDVMMDTDAHLVARARHGDHFAFGQLVQRHRSSVQRAARMVLGSATDAEDVAQDAWLHAYVHLPQFQETASFKTWVHAIVRNRAIDHHRWTRRRPWYDGATRVAAVPTRAELRSDFRTPEELVLDAECQDQLAAAIATLPARLRVLLELWHTGQYSYGEMALIADVRKSTIKSRIWEARHRVTQALSHTVPVPRSEQAGGRPSRVRSATRLRAERSLDSGAHRPDVCRFEIS